MMAEYAYDIKAASVPIAAAAMWMDTSSSPMAALSTKT